MPVSFQTPSGNGGSEMQYASGSFEYHTSNPSVALDFTPFLVIAYHVGGSSSSNVAMISTRNFTIRTAASPAIGVVQSLISENAIDFSGAIFTDSGDTILYHAFG